MNSRSFQRTTILSGRSGPGTSIHDNVDSLEIKQIPIWQQRNIRPDFRMDVQLLHLATRRFDAGTSTVTKWMTSEITVLVYNKKTCKCQQVKQKHCVWWRVLRGLRHFGVGVDSSLFKPSFFVALQRSFLFPKLKLDVCGYWAGHKILALAGQVCFHFFFRINWSSYSEGHKILVLAGQVSFHLFSELTEAVYTRFAFII